MSENFHGDVSVLRTLKGRRVDSDALSITGTTALDQHSPSIVLANISAAADLTIPSINLAPGWAVLAKNSGLSTASLSIKVGSNVIVELKAGQAARVISKVAAPTTAVDFEVIFVFPIDASGNLNMGSAKIINVTDPTSAQDAATKAYVDAQRDLGVLNFVKSFNAAADWGTAAGGYYTIAVPQATHLQGLKVMMQLQDSSGRIVHADEMIAAPASGDVSIRVPDSPDLRFAGILTIAKLR